MPLDLSGQSVLHIGCGTGELVAEAARRGAARVIGLDRDPDAILVAREHGLDESVDLIEGDWRMPPEGPFDLILWVDSFVCEPDPRGVLETLRNRLAPSGLLILACQIHNAPGKQMCYGPIGDGDVYPTMSMLRDMLRRYAVRVVHRADPPSGRVLEPWTFWCRARRSTVLLIRGHGNTGKSGLTQLLTPVASQVVELDSTIPELRFSQRPSGPVAAFAAAHAHPRMLGTFFESVDEAGLTEEYVDAVLHAIIPGDDLTIVDGFLTDRQAELLTQRMTERGAFVWDVQRDNADTALAATLEVALAEQTARAATLEVTLAEQTARAATLEVALAEQTTLSSSLRASRSWRLTDPARRAARLMRRGSANENRRW